MNAAIRSKFAVAPASGMFSSPQRDAVSEKDNSSNVKCSEIFMSDFRARFSYPGIFVCQIFVS
jgi:hypothetical protein